MIELDTRQLNEKQQFINQYVAASNAASGSKYDQNANVAHKNIATLAAELNKDINIQINRHATAERIKDLFGEPLSKEYIRQIEDHEIYSHDESAVPGTPYCASVSLYPLLTEGLVSMGGESKAPKNIESFCGIFINFLFAASAQYAGAVAATELPLYLTYFARKTYGEDYLSTHREEMKAHLQHIVYSINQPAAARGFQSVFFNTSLFDKEYYESLFGDFMFPDGEYVEYQHLAEFQEFFMDWLNEERKKALLTFPVITAAMLIDKETKQIKDKDFAEFCANQLAKGSSFFIYQSESADSLSSCCRLSNSIEDDVFSNSLGAGGVATGSVKVTTINLNRCVQKGIDLKEQTKKCQKYLYAYRTLVEDMIDNKMLPMYDSGFISLDKQYITIGLNGVVEAAEYLGYDVSNNKTYKQFLKDTFSCIKEENKKFRKEMNVLINTELVPAESLGVKFAKWDKQDNLKVGRDCYNSYFYKVEDECISILDKFWLYSTDMVKNLDGGSALHLNLSNHLPAEGYRALLDTAAKTGCNFFCTNVLLTVCNECGYINKHTVGDCSKCFSSDVSYATRVIGYLRKIDSFSIGRQQEHKHRYYH